MSAGRTREAKPSRGQELRISRSRLIASGTSRFRNDRLLYLSTSAFRPDSVTISR